MTDVAIQYPSSEPAAEFAVNRLTSLLRSRGKSVRVGRGGEAIIDLAVDETMTSHSGDGFTIESTPQKIAIRAPEVAGVLYGGLELAEQFEQGTTLEEIRDTSVNPAVNFRALKFNLPWSPYRSGAETEIHYDTCRDRSFWRSFLDMMAANRFNALTLWNLHPFPYLIRPDGYPEACPFSDDELAVWQDFWHDLFRMAADRCIDTYLLNWNIVVSPSFAEAYDVEELNDRSDIVADYTRECVTQTIETYPNLSGLGVSLCDWMSGMEPEEKQQWFSKTFLAGIENASRPIKLLNRSVLTESISAMRETIEEAAAIDTIDEIRVPTKFNWSHGHSTTSLELTHDYASGDVDDALWDPQPEDYSIAWTVRNEDCFLLRWGDPDFVRAHLAENHADVPYVDGYIVGSEGYIPAAEYTHQRHHHATWQYSFERQWLFYEVWGRLLYDPTTPDRVFEASFDRRYRPGVGADLLEGYRLGSRMIQELASFYAGTWDYTLYSEGFLAPAPSLGPHDGQSAFISIDEFIHHEPLDPEYCDIPTFVGGTGDGITPLELADRVERNSDRVMDIADRLRADLRRGDGALACEIDTLEAWGWLNRYLAAKLRGGVALHRFRQEGDPQEQKTAIEQLRIARDCWDGVSAVTDRHYQPVPYASDWQADQSFLWSHYRSDVERDIEIAINATPSNGREDT